MRPTVRPWASGTRLCVAASATSAGHAVIASDTPWHDPPAHSPLQLWARPDKQAGPGRAAPALDLRNSLRLSSGLGASTRQGQPGDFPRTLFMVHVGKSTNPKTDGAGQNTLGKYLRRTRLPGGASVPQPLS